MITILAAALMQAMAPEPVSPSSAAPPPETAAQQLVGLQQVYERSCGDRAYGSYNDLCNGMRDQIGVVRRQAARDAAAARRAARAHAPAAPPAPAVTQSGTPALGFAGPRPGDR